MRFIDSNIFIYVLTADPHYGFRAKEILKAVEKGEKAATSTLNLIQVCSYLRWKRRAEIIPVFLSLIWSLPTLIIYQITMNDFIRFQRIQRIFNLPWSMWDDILIAAQMERLGIKEIYSNDRDFDKIPWITRIF
ncbi:PIN domain nuclease [Candidatus Bathyarchaeota archaeon]|nr:MAG: PIN domain nuclease [Candidatus Bathyarchaeota archaeon]HDI42156.1 type II toxin-antitoxin system VapC family toxin [Candidatus Bathyarchaeota archaeon]